MWCVKSVHFDVVFFKTEEKAELIRIFSKNVLEVGGSLKMVQNIVSSKLSDKIEIEQLHI